MPTRKTSSTPSSQGERLMKVEILLQNMLENFTDRFDRLESSINQRFAKIKEEQDGIKSDIRAIREEEGNQLKMLKNRAIEYVMIAILAGIIGALGKALFTGGL